ncbi:MAG: hypothetical protein K9K38_05620 [Rhodoferax sp.]|nr:hypothetical protein [Rhodoferax sp.]
MEKLQLNNQTILIEDEPVLNTTRSTNALNELIQYVKNARIHQGYKTIDDLVSAYPFKNNSKFCKFVEQLESTGTSTNVAFLKTLRTLINIDNISRLTREYNHLVEKEKIAYEKSVRLARDSLTGNVKLLIKNKDLIIKNPRYFYIKHSRIYISTAYMHRSAAYTLGEMLDHWQNDEMTDDKVCCGKFYILAAGGSPLSGSTSFFGFCSKCGKWSTERDSSFSSILGPFMKYKQPDFDTAAEDVASFDELILALGGKLSNSD